MSFTESSIEDTDNKFQRDVFPSYWKNPSVVEEYDLVIVGAGPGGLTAASIAKEFQAKVALIEKEHFGGECLSAGCIPSKALLRSSRSIAEIRRAMKQGVKIDDLKIDFPGIVKRVHRLQATISPHDAVEHFKKMGIDIFLGVGQFVGPNKIKVNEQVITFKKAIITTGTEPILLPGLNLNEYLTNQNIFKVKTIPPRLGVIGGGPIGCELGQAFARFGSKVTLITHASHLLSKEDFLAAKRLQKVFEDEGITIMTRSRVEKIEKDGHQKHIIIESNTKPIVVDEVLLAIGRKPAIHQLNLEQANVSFDEKKGILTNEFLQTSNPDIYASGDVTSPYKFTHISQELANIAVNNALNVNQQKINSLVIPWCTYTDPEIAHIEYLEKKHDEVETVFVEMSDVDRALLDGETIGYLKLIVKANSHQIVGATLMATHAGDMISEISVAMASENGLLALSKAIHPFPTQGQILQLAAKTLLKNREKKLAVAVS